MLTKKQNLLETIKGGSPDRFVDQYEFMAMLLGNPVTGPMPGPGETVTNLWGVTMTWPEGMPGPMPVHDEEHIVIKDITKWHEYVKGPEVVYPEEAWAPFTAEAEKVDRNEQYATMFVAPGLLEQCHHLCEIKNFFEYIIDEPEAVHGLIDYLADWEIRYAEQFIKYIKPDAVFHHDDWGSHTSTFLSPAMFEEFYVPAYKKIYGYYKDNGVELIVHHSDSFAATLVPYMIDMGIDIWQGVVTTNNIPELIEKYGKQLSIMGGIDSGVVDRADWTQEHIDKEVRRACEENGKLYFIPCGSQGLAMSTFSGVYEGISEAIHKMDKEMF